MDRALLAAAVPLALLAVADGAAALSGCTGASLEELLAGKPCNPAGECAAGYVCDTSQNRCVPEGTFTGTDGSAGGGTGGGGTGGGSTGGGSTGGATPCTDSGQCLSSHCVDGVCCDSECGGLCEACAAALTGGVDGVCDFVLAGTDPDAECPPHESCDGGGSCSKKADGLPCDSPVECLSAGCCDDVCDACCNGQQDGAETDVDCGGGTCPGCGVAEECSVDGDCASNLCCTSDCASGWSGECLPGSCGNSAKDNDETDVDCGGGTCPKCATGKSCGSDSDCQSDDCPNGTCL